MEYAWPLGRDLDDGLCCVMRTLIGCHQPTELTRLFLPNCSKPFKNRQLRKQVHAYLVLGCRCSVSIVAAFYRSGNSACLKIHESKNNVRVDPAAFHCLHNLFCPDIQICLGIYFKVPASSLPHALLSAALLYPWPTKFKHPRQNLLDLHNFILTWKSLIEMMGGRRSS